MWFKGLFCAALIVSCAFSTDAVAQENSDTVYAYYEEAVISFNKEEYETSYIHLKNALDIDPDHLPSKILIGRLLLINNLPEAAITEFEEALLPALILISFSFLCFVPIFLCKNLKNPPQYHCKTFPEITNSKFTCSKQVLTTIPTTPNWRLRTTKKRNY